MYIVENIAQNLEQFGLDEKETKVYLSVLALGQASVSTIAKHAGIERTGTYDVLDRLVAQSLAQPVQTGKVIGFTASDPQQFLRGIDARRSRFVALLPQLEALYGKSQIKPIERFFEGNDEINALFSGLSLLRDTAIRVIYTQPDDQWKPFSDLLATWSSRKNDIKILALEPDSVTGGSGISVRQFVPAQGSALSIIVFNETTIYFSPTEKPYAWRVLSAQVAHLQSTLFSELWRGSR